MKFQAKVLREFPQLVYLVRGSDKGRATWYYVRVIKQKLKFFQKALEKDAIDLRDFGEILFSGYGEEPPQDIQNRIKSMLS